jgi:hypothetical protein
VFKNLKRIGAALIIAVMILPHFVLAGIMSPTQGSCRDDQQDDNGAVDLACVYNTGDSAPHVTGDILDGNTSTGIHINGPNYPILFTVYLGGAYDVTGLNITHGPDGAWGGSANRIATTATNANNIVQYGPSTSEWYSFGTIPAYDDDNDLVAEVTGSATATYLRIWNYENHGDAAAWSIAEITVSTALPGAPEMEVWALFVILPMMFFVVYKTAPDIGLLKV